MVLDLAGRFLGVMVGPGGGLILLTGDGDGVIVGATLPGTDQNGTNFSHNSLFSKVLGSQLCFQHTSRLGHQRKLLWPTFDNTRLNAIRSVRNLFLRHYLNKFLIATRIV